MIALALVAQLLMPPAPDSPIVGQLFAPEWVQPGSGSRAPFVNVRGWPYYACGDGVCDDTAAIQAAVTAAAGKMVVYPCGTYLHGQITISASNTTVAGASRKCVTLKEASASATGMFNLTSGPLTNIVFRELTLDANGKTPTMNAYQSGLAPVNPAINLGVFNVGTDVTGLVIEGLDVAGFDQGLYIPFNASASLVHSSFIRNSTWTGLSPSVQKDHICLKLNADTSLVQGNTCTGWTNGINPTIRAFELKVLGNFIYMAANGNDVGIYASKCTNCVIADNYFKLTGASNALADGCIKLGAGTGGGTDANNTIVHHNTCNAGQIKISQASDLTVDHNRVFDAPNTGCGHSICVTSENSNPRITIDSNTISGGAGSCIQYRGTDAVSITGNVCDAPGSVGFEVYTATNGWVISGNRARETTLHCIYVDGSTYGTVSGNSCFHSATGSVPGIRVGGTSSYVTVTGNTSNGYARGIQIDTGTNTSNVVVSNSFVATTTFGYNIDGSSVSGLVALNSIPAGTSSTLASGNSCPSENKGTVTLSSGTPSTATATVLACTTKCLCTNGTTQANPIKCAVSGTTLTATGPNTVTDVVNYSCF